MNSGQAFTEVQMEAVIIRADGSKENLGVVAYWHRNPLMRLLYQLKTYARRAKWLQK